MELTPREFVADLFQSRYTAKGYDPGKTISEQDFLTILEAGRMSPSSMGLEPWAFVDLQDQVLIDQLRPACWGVPDAMRNHARLILLLTRTGAQMRPGAPYVYHIMTEVQGFTGEALNARLQKYESFLYQDMNLVSDREIHDWASRQTYIALANMLTTAAILGVDSTPIEGFNKASVQEILTTAGVYAPEEFGISAMLALGYTNKPHRPKTRRTQVEVVRKF